MELLCRCDDIADDGVELRVLKGLLTAVTSNTLHIHGQALLLVRVHQPAANSSPVPADAATGVQQLQTAPRFAVRLQHSMGGSLLAAAESRAIFVERIFNKQ